MYITATASTLSQTKDTPTVWDQGIPPSGNPPVLWSAGLHTQPNPPVGNTPSITATTQTNPRPAPTTNKPSHLSGNMGSSSHSHSTQPQEEDKNKFPVLHMAAVHTGPTFTDRFHLCT